MVLLGCSCGANEGVLRSGKETPLSLTAETVKSSFDSDLDSMRTARFTTIFVLRRKDGGMIDAEGRGVIKLNTGDANRRVSTDDGRAFIIGSNFLLKPENMAALHSRFVVEDFSPPADANSNTNANIQK